jgi:hypothetical protein
MYVKKGEQWQAMDLRKGERCKQYVWIGVPAVGGVRLIAGAADLYSRVGPSSKQVTRQGRTFVKRLIASYNGSR